MIISLQHGHADVILHGDDTHEENAQCGNKLRHGGAERGLHAEVVNHSSEDTGQGIDVFAENQGHLID